MLFSHVTYRTPCHARGHSHSFSHPTLVIPHSPVDYRQVFKPILYFQPSPAQSDLQLYPTPILPREAEDFPRGDNHSKHAPLPTYLA